MTSEVENISFNTTNRNVQMPTFFFKLNCHRMEWTGLWDIKGSEDSSKLPSKIDQMKQVKLILDKIWDTAIEWDK